MHTLCVCFLSAAQLDVDYLERVTSSSTDEVGLTPNCRQCVEVDAFFSVLVAECPCTPESVCQV